MTDLVASPVICRTPLSRGRMEGLVVALAVAATAGMIAGRAYAADPALSEPALVLLLRFMAGCKATCVAGAAALLLWRLGRPLGVAAYTRYLAGVACMAAAPGLIWGLGLVAPGALLFHAGLLIYSVIALQDDDMAAGLAWRRRG